MVKKCLVSLNTILSLILTEFLGNQGMLRDSDFTECFEKFECNQTQGYNQNCLIDFLC
jgi:hypothetical protein